MTSGATDVQVSAVRAGGCAAWSPSTGPACTTGASSVLTGPWPDHPDTSAVAPRSPRPAARPPRTSAPPRGEAQATNRNPVGHAALPPPPPAGCARRVHHVCGPSTSRSPSTRPQAARRTPGPRAAARNRRFGAPDTTRPTTHASSGAGPCPRARSARRSHTAGRSQGPAVPRPRTAAATAPPTAAMIGHPSLPWSRTAAPFAEPTPVCPAGACSRQTSAAVAAADDKPPVSQALHRPNCAPPTCDSATRTCVKNVTTLTHFKTQVTGARNDKWLFQAPPHVARTSERASREPVCAVINAEGVAPCDLRVVCIALRPKWRGRGLATSVSARRESVRVIHFASCNATEPLSLNFGCRSPDSLNIRAPWLARSDRAGVVGGGGHADRSSHTPIAVEHAQRATVE